MGHTMERHSLTPHDAPRTASDSFSSYVWSNAACAVGSGRMLLGYASQGFMRLRCCLYSLRMSSVGQLVVASASWTLDFVSTMS